MPKKTIRDIKIQKRTPVKKTASVRTVKKAAPTVKKTVKKKTSTKRRQPVGFTHSYNEHRGEGSGSKAWLWVLLVIILGGLVAWTFMGSARVDITPEFDRVTGKVTLTAEKEATNDGFEYEVITIDDTLSQTVSAGEAEFVEEKAQGTIVVYNEELKEQRLIEETRFESAEGLIYKLAKGKAITVPAASGGTPGSLEVTVYADQPGEEYNVDLTDFVIPGWRETNSPKFETQYARSKTAMTGGFSGTKRVVDDADKERTQGTLRDMLGDRLIKEAPAQIPEAFVLFPELSSTSFASLPATDGAGGKVDMKEEGMLYGLLFNRRELSSLLAAELVEGYVDEPILVTNFDEVVITLDTPAVLDESVSSVTFTVEGELDFEWQIDTESIGGAVVGVAKKDLNKVLASFPGIKKASLTTYPTWLRKIPEKVKIDVLPVGE